MKRINIACNYSSVYSGNFIPSMFELAKKLRDDVHVVFSFPIAAKDRYWVSYLKENGFEVYYFRNSSKSAVVKDIKKINKTNKINCLYTHFLSMSIVKLCCLFSKKIELIMHIHSDFRNGNNFIGFFTKIRNLIFKKIFRRDASFIYVSETLMSEDNNANSYYVRNALCINRIVNKSITIDDEAFNNNYIKILMFGWSPETKGVDIVCDAFTNLTDVIKNKYMLYIVADENGTAKCAEFVNQRLKIDVLKEKNIVFIEPTEDVFGLFERTDIFISASRSEGFSYSILEALYFGLCVFSSDIDGTRWSSKYGAKLFDINKIDELKRLMTELSDCKTKKKKNEFILSDFSIDTWVSDIKKIILK